MFHMARRNMMSVVVAVAGFTVDDGPLRKQDDPANKPFLQSIELGECPHELEPSDRKTPVSNSTLCAFICLL